MWSVLQGAVCECHYWSRPPPCLFARLPVVSHQIQLNHELDKLVCHPIFRPHFSCLPSINCKLLPVRWLTLWHLCCQIWLESVRNKYSLDGNERVSLVSVRSTALELVAFPVSLRGGEIKVTDQTLYTSDYCWYIEIYKKISLFCTNF